MAIDPVTLGDVDARLKVNQAFVELAAAQDAITAESAARGLGDTTEASARIAGDAAVTALIAPAVAAEAAIRLAADNTEAGARLAADLALPIAAPLHHRPGDAPVNFTTQLGSTAEALQPPVSTALVRSSELGSVIRLASGGIVAARWLYAIEPGRRYAVTFAVRRHVNPLDPSNDTVRFGLAWHDQTKAYTGQATAADNNAMTEGDGRVLLRVHVAAVAAAGVDIVAPAGTRYCRPYVQDFTGTGQTDVEIVGWVDVTDIAATGGAADFSALNTRVADLESLDAGDRITALESAVTAPKTLFVTATTSLGSTSPVASVQRIVTLGYSAPNDGGGAAWIRASAGAGAGKRQDALGSWWIIAEAEIMPEMLGANATAATDTAAFFEAAGTGKDIRLSARVYLISRAETGFTNLPAKIAITGVPNRTIIRWVGATTGPLLTVLAGTLNIFTARYVIFDGDYASVATPATYHAMLHLTGAAGSTFDVDTCEFTRGRDVDLRVAGPTVDGERVRLRLRNSVFSEGQVTTDGWALMCVQLQDNVDVDVVDNTLYRSARPGTYGRGGIIIQRAAGSPLTTYVSGDISNNTLKNLGRGTDNFLGAIDCYSGAKSLRIHDNDVYTCNGRGITAKGDQSNVSIYDNTIDGVFGAGGVALGLGLMQDVFNAIADQVCRIEGNTVLNSDGDGIFVDGAGVGGANYGDIYVNDNIVLGCAGRPIYVRSVAAFAQIRKNRAVGGTKCLSGTIAATQIEIVENNFSGSSSHVIDLGTTDMSSSNVIIRGGSLIGPSAGAAGVRCVSLPAVRSYRIENVNFDNAAAAIFTTGSTTASLIDGNRFDSGITGTWSKGGTDAEVWYGENNFGVDLNYTLRNRTILNGEIDVFTSWHYVTGEGSPAANDDLIKVNGLPRNRRVTLIAASSTVDITLKDNVVGGNLQLSADFVLDYNLDTIVLWNGAGTIRQLSTANNF